MSRIALLGAAALVVGIAACSSAASGPAADTAPETEAPDNAAPAAEAPPAEDILEAYIEATGGRQAREGKDSYRARGSVSLVEMGVEGTVEVLAAAPRKMLLRMSLAGLGDQEQGTDGEVAWERSAMTGSRVLDGAERTRFLRSATMHADLAWRELYEAVETRGADEIDGRPVWAVAFTTPEGSVDISYYDQETHLLVAQEATVQSQMGEMEVRSRYGDYREVDGLSMAHRVEENMVNVTVVTTMEEIDYGADIPEDTFEMPADIAALQGDGAN